MILANCSSSSISIREILINRQTYHSHSVYLHLELLVIQLCPKRLLPKTAGKRRQFLRESEDDSEELFVGQYIYRRDPCRSTSLSLSLFISMIHDKLKRLQQGMRYVNRAAKRKHLQQRWRYIDGAAMLKSSIRDRIEAHPDIRTSVRAMLE